VTRVCLGGAKRHLRLSFVLRMIVVCSVGVKRRGASVYHSFFG
jgi:hypothetical protein